jgi:hypothetical protein
MTFAELWREFEPLGRDPQTGGYRRYSWTPADAACRAWFTDQARRRGLAVETDNNGNLWAWWGPKGPRMPSRPAATWIRSRTAAASTGHWAWSPRWPPWTC